MRVCFSLSCQKEDSSKREPSGTSSGPSSDPEFAKRGHLENTKPLERSGLVEQTVGLMKFYRQQRLSDKLPLICGFDHAATGAA